MILEYPFLKTRLRNVTFSFQRRAVNTTAAFS